MKGILDSLSRGILVYDSSGRISVCNEKLRALLNVRSRDRQALTLSGVVRNRALLDFLEGPHADEPRVFSLADRALVVRRFETAEGTVAIFRDEIGHVSAKAQNRLLPDDGFFEGFARPQESCSEAAAPGLSAVDSLLLESLAQLEAEGRGAGLVGGAGGLERARPQPGHGARPARRAGAQGLGDFWEGTIGDTAQYGR